MKLLGSSAPSLLWIVLLFPSIYSVQCFTQSTSSCGRKIITPASSSTAKFAKGSHVKSKYLWNDFKTYSGEILNPYKVLKVSRRASTEEIKKAYRALSRKYHPDGVRHRGILPGSCDNLDDVREQWERINLSYKILKDVKLRKRFDRNEVIADPGKAVQRAMFDAAGSAVMGVGKGLFSVGAMAVGQVMKQKEDNPANVTPADVKET